MGKRTPRYIFVGSEKVKIPRRKGAYVNMPCINCETPHIKVRDRFRCVCAECSMPYTIHHEGRKV